MELLTVDPASEGIVYVSLGAGTVPRGTGVEVRNDNSGFTVFQAVMDGGSDPSAIPASGGDRIALRVYEGSNAVAQYDREVPSHAPPIVVRTEPRPGKPDVPLNPTVIVVFSEPIDAASVTASSIRLFRGTSAIAGTLRLLPGNGTVAAFTPAALLEANTEYVLEIEQSPRDLEGDALAAARTVEFTTGSSMIGTAASIQTVPDSTLSLPRGDSYQVAAIVRDADGNILVDAPVIWDVVTNDDPAGLVVSSTGVVTANADGFYLVGASSGGVSDLLLVFVPATPAASVAVDPTSTEVGADATVLLAANVRDSAGRLINRPSVSWTSSDPATATIEFDHEASGDTFGVVFGRVHGLTPGTVTITASSGSASATADVTVTEAEPIQLVSVSAGFRYTCGLDEDGAAYCWGSDYYGALGNGASGSSPRPVAVSGGLAFASISSGVGDYSWEQENYGEAESPHTCARTVNGDAYCWGANTYGQLGHGSGADSPTHVEGDLTLSMVSAGAWHTCGLTPEGAAYCWGWATALDGSDSRSPVAVPGGRTFTTITAGNSWSGPGTCALTATGTAYCWATNGDPTAVGGNLSLSTLSIGFDHVCGVTTDGAAYCWGGNAYGQLGDGSTTSSITEPVAVAGGLTFTSVSAGTEFSCGVASGGAAYCWGSNADGQLGTGSFNAQGVETPVAVAGGLTFTTVDAGEYHACGIDVDGIAWCWGGNASGELGIGSTASSNLPVRVARQP